HLVVVDDADGAYASRREIENRGAAQAAGAYDQHARAFQLCLSDATHFTQHKVAGVALDFGVRELHGPPLRAAQQARKLWKHIFAGAPPDAASGKIRGNRGISPDTKLGVLR